MTDETQPSPAVAREQFAVFVANAISRSAQQHVPVGYRVADALLARYDIRERGETQPEPQKPKDYLEEGGRVSAHQLDRIRSVVVGTLMPYDESEGERVRDDAGVVWCVDASSVRPVPGDQS